MDVFSKEVNKQRNDKHLLLRKTYVLKTFFRKINFPERNFEEMQKL